MSSSTTLETTVSCREQFKCELAPYQHTHYCVLHLPSADKTAAFEQALSKRLRDQNFDFRGVWFPAKANFSNFPFTDEVSFEQATFNGEAVFTSATFEKAVSFKSARFGGDATFSGVILGGQADFDKATFHRTVDFRRSIFSEAASFRSSKFEEPVTFDRATFDAEVSFNNSTFRQRADFATRFRDRADFSQSEFEGLAEFTRVNFEKQANFFSTKFISTSTFDYATFNSSTTFNTATFVGPVNFRSATFGEIANFSEVSFQARVLFNSVKFNGQANFQFANFKDYVRFNQVLFLGSPPNFREVEFDKPGLISFHSMSLRPFWFVEVNATEFALSNVTWDWRLISIDEEIAEILKHYEQLPSHRAAYTLLAIACWNLAVNAEENHRYDEASRFRYLAMELRRKDSLYRDVPRKLAWRKTLIGWFGRDRKIQRSPPDKSNVFRNSPSRRVGPLHWLYWLLSGYGERIMRALLVLIGIWAMFGFIYAVVLRDDYDKALGWRGLPYSAAVITLQRPQPSPSPGVQQALVTLETILGPLQVALLALAIRRKFMR